jgi:predicted GNAT family N-acyltransferase
MPSELPVCRRVATREEMDACFAIRKAVFMREQKVDPAIERDGLDASCIHYIGEVAGKPVATARTRMLGDKIKIERVAVSKTARGTGAGAALMRFLMADIVANEDIAGKVFFLSSQSQAIAFYERLGFVVCSEEYFEAGIAHRDMRAEVGEFQDSS